MSLEEIMQVAIAEAQKSGTPYGAVITLDNQIIAKAFNTVELDQDPTAHAEVNVIRKLTSKLKNVSLAGYTLYSTCEPCPMCAAACVWADFSEIVYGVGKDDFADYDPNLIPIRCREVIARAPNHIKLTSGVLMQECRKLHEQN